LYSIALTTEVETSRTKTNASFNLVLPLNLSTPSSQIVMQMKTVNTGKALKLLGSDFASFIIFLEILVMGKPY